MHFWHHSQGWIENRFGNLPHIICIINMNSRIQLEPENIQVLIIPGIFSVSKIMGIKMLLKIFTCAVIESVM